MVGLLMFSLYFYPRSPCGERLWPGLLARPFFLISIHALLAESDPVHFMRSWRTTIFLSTLSLRRATMIKLYTDEGWPFLSTLSLRRATRRTQSLQIPLSFLSTLSLRRATTQMQAAFKGPEISIHALLAESDLFLRSGPMTRRYFYPRSPCGERRVTLHDLVKHFFISIHALLAESD